MDWIKRNLFFVIGAAVALLLLGGAGYYNFAGWKHNADAREKLNAQYEELRRLTSLKPSPGSGKVDNIGEAKKQQAEVLAVLEKIAAHFQPIAPIPAPNADSPSNRVSSEAFASALRRTIDQLQRDALNASVSLPPKYGFSFEAQRSLVKFAPGIRQTSVLAPD